MTIQSEIHESSRIRFQQTVSRHGSVQYHIRGSPSLELAVVLPKDQTNLVAECRSKEALALTAAWWFNKWLVLIVVTPPPPRPVLRLLFSTTNTQDRSSRARRFGLCLDRSSPRLDWLLAGRDVQTSGRGKFREITTGNHRRDYHRRRDCYHHQHLKNSKSSLFAYASMVAAAWRPS